MEGGTVNRNAAKKGHTPSCPFPEISKNHVKLTKGKQKDIANKIKDNLAIKFGEYSFSVDEKKHEIYINTNRQMKTNKDALELAHLVDNVVMLYIAESKK